jgi:hypothetical protein
MPLATHNLSVPAVTYKCAHHLGWKFGYFRVGIELRLHMYWLYANVV